MTQWEMFLSQNLIDFSLHSLQPLSCTIEKHSFHKTTQISLLPVFNLCHTLRIVLTKPHIYLLAHFTFITHKETFFSQNIKCMKTIKLGWNSNFTKISAFLNFDSRFYFSYYWIHFLNFDSMFFSYYQIQLLELQLEVFFSLLSNSSFWISTWGFFFLLPNLSCVVQAIQSFGQTKDLHPQFHRLFKYV